MYILLCALICNFDDILHRFPIITTIYRYNLKCSPTTCPPKRSWQPSSCGVQVSGRSLPFICWDLGALLLGCGLQQQWLLYTLEELLGRSLSQQRIVVMIAMISKRSPPTQSTTTTTTTKRNNNIAITMITDLVSTKSSTLTLQACFVLGFLLQTSLAYRLDPNPQTNSIFATVPSSSISSSLTSSSQTSSQLSSSSSKHGVKVFYQSGVSNSNFINI